MPGDEDQDGETLCLDGTTIRASNGRKQSTSVELSRKKLEYARAQLEAVERFLDGMDENDLHEDRIDHPFALDLDKDHLPDPQTLRERIAFHEKCIEELENSGRSAMTFTDPECAMTPAKEGGIKACYNVQTVVDASSHMIADFHVTDSPSDRGQIFESVEMCRKNLGLESVNVIADKGYESAEDIENCLMNGVAADVGFIQDREERVFSLDYVEREIAPEQKASQKPEDIQTCLRAGVLPDCYEDSNIRGAGAVAGADQLLHPTRGRHGDLPRGPAAVPQKRHQVRNRLLQPGCLPNLSQPLHRFEEAEARQHRAQQRLRARRHVRRPALPPPADSGRCADLAAQQFRQIKARRKARHGVHPERYSQAEAPPADQRASLRHHQALR